MPARTVLVTGATDGIGRATAHALAAQGARVLVHGRDPAKVRDVSTAVGGDSLGFVADLSSLAAVRDLAAQVRDRVGAVDVLLNNAGVFVKGERRLSADGYELTLAVNHLAPFLLTRELLPALARGRDARVVTVSSIAHNRGRVPWEDLQLAQGWDSSGYPAYAWSKLANVLFSNALARRVADQGITSNSLHPGVISTKLLREGFGMSGATVETGAETSVHCALSPHVAGVTGAYFSDSQVVEASRRARTVQAQERFWHLSEGLVTQALA